MNDSIATRKAATWAKFDFPGEVPSNFHTHSTFCDGADTPEEMVREALRLGCPALGFSGHSYTSFDPEGCMSPEGTLEYQREVRRLQEAYAGQITLLLGIEQDFYADMPAVGAGFDYIIGSVHFVKKDGCILPIDISKETQMATARDHYDGDYYALAEDYFTTVAQVHERTGCDIIGHFDLIMKYNDDGSLFDPTHPRYVEAATRALDALLDTPAIFEINTGAMSRGYRSAPYPESWIVRYLEDRGEKLLRTSDCHDKNYLLFNL